MFKGLVAMRILLCILVLYGAFAFAQSLKSYVVTCSDRIIPGVPLDVRVSILTSQGDVTVAASLENSAGDMVFAKESKKFVKGVTDYIHLQVPDGLQRSTYKLVVQGSGGLAFQNESSLIYDDKWPLIYIQTDKTRYSAGQEVKYRAILLLPNLLGYSGNVNLTVFDGKQNKVQASGPMNPKDGVINGTLKLSSEPVFGDWMIEVSALAKSTTKTITVNDYVLPKFSVDIDLPAKLRTTDAVLHVNVSARFTFDADVFGNCTIQLYSPSDTYLYLVYSKEIKGQTGFDIPMLNITNKFGSSSVKVRALVTDNATALTIATEVDLEYYQEPYKYKPLISLKIYDHNRDAFVPGLTYYLTLFVGREDEPLHTKGTITVTPTIKTAQVMPCYLNNPPTQWLKVETTTLQMFTTEFDESGYAPLKFHVPLHTETVSLVLNYNASLVDTIKLTSIPRNIPVQLRIWPNKPNIRVGDMMTFTVEATAHLNGSLLAEVYAGGLIIETKTIKLHSKNTTVFMIQTTNDMVPHCYVVVTHITSNGELINDYNLIHVEGTPFKNNVSITFDKTIYQPGENMAIQITADPNSNVYLLTEDKRNRLLGEENDIYRTNVFTDVMKRSHDIKENIVDYPKYRKMGSRARREHSEYGDTDDVFVEAGALFLSDVPVFDMTSASIDFLSSDTTLPRKCFHITTVPPGVFPTWVPGMVATPNPGFTYAPNKIPTPAPGQTYAPGVFPTWVPGGGEQLALGSLVRSKFPETWIWDEYNIGSSGHMTLNMKVPDTITSWISSVFATNQLTGFGIQEYKPSITVKKDFFVTMDLPTSIVYGEEFLLQLTVFNYMSSMQQVFLQVTTSDDPNRPIPAATMVNPGKGHSTFLHITPKNIGTMNITVVAKAGLFTSMATDKLKKGVVVKPHGVHRKTNEQHMIDVSTQGGPYLKQVSIKQPVNYVNGTMSTSLKITGNFMAPSIDGLQSLISMPYGCGEQTMLNFAPDIYITKYLKTVGKLTADVEAKSQRFMMSGLQRELTYKHSDGSFSAFGNRDTSGSSWLTSFVLKCFRQARGLLNIDDSIMTKAMVWLLRYQRQDGSFKEPGRIIHTQMQAGTSSGPKLTAFILNAVLENQDISGIDSAKMNAVIQKGRAYLETKLNNINDMYTLAIVCYTLSMSKSSHSPTCLTRIKAAAILDGDRMYWKAKENTHGRRSTTSIRAPSADIEATSYCLLTYMALSHNLDTLSIVKWLVSQRNPNGGFQSTQDTVISLQALAEYSSQHSTSDSSHSVNLQVYSGAYHHSYAVTSLNKDLVHRAEIPKDLNDLVVLANGQGVAVVDVTSSYYISGISGSTLSVSATLPHENINSVTVRPCVRWQGTIDSGMILMEVEMPTGFISDVDELKSQTIIKRHETNGRNVAIYFDGFAVNEELCVNVKMDRSDPVVRSQACHITVYDYYEPTNQIMIRYESGILKRSNICDVCPLCNFCTGSSVGQIGIGK